MDQPRSTVDELSRERTGPTDPNAATDQLTVPPIGRTPSKGTGSATGKAGRGSRLAALLMALSGGAMAGATFLTWSAYHLAQRRNGGQGGRSGHLSGLQFTDGRLLLGAGIALVVLAVLLLSLRRQPLGLAAATTGLVLGVVGLTVTLSSLGSTLGSSAVGALKPHLLRRIESSWGPGFYVAIGAAALAVVASTLGLLSFNGRSASRAAETS